MCDAIRALKGKRGGEESLGCCSETRTSHQVGARATGRPLVLIFGQQTLDCRRGLLCLDC